MKAVLSVIFIALALLAVGVYLFIEKPEIVSRFFSSKINIMTIISPSFENGRFIPPTFSCDGQNINPVLSIAEVPKGAKSLALTVNDPDAPSGSFVHWIMWNLSPDTKTIPQDAEAVAALNMTSPANQIFGREGINGTGYIGYTGPCPPSGTHHYIFKLYALDTMLELDSATTKPMLERAMAGHILAEAELTGLYGRVK